MTIDEVYVVTKGHRVIFRCIFVNEKFCIFIRISLNFVPKGLINNSPE